MPIPAPRESGFTATTAVPLYWAAYGVVGAPRLLVLHGGPGAHHDYLLPQMLRLAESYDVLFYDQRGGGRSATDDRAPITWRTHVDDLALVVRELGLDPLALVGYSWGAMLAALYAIETADGTPPAPSPERMMLIDPAPLTRAYREQFEAEFARRQRSPLVQTMRAELEQTGLRDRDPAAYRQRIFELGVAGYFADPRRARDLTPFRVMGRVQQQVWASLGDFDVITPLADVRCPTLITHGRQDPIPLASSRDAARAMPNAELVIFEQCGHVPYVEAEEVLFATMLAWLAATDSPALS